MTLITCVLLGFSLLISAPLPAADLAADVKADYDAVLWPLFEHFHRNPELSTIESETARRIAEELRAAGFDVTEGVGGTGVVAIMKNGDGPMVMMRADMDGLPLQEKSGLEYASHRRQLDPITGHEVSVMHACGHDVHITSLVGTAHQMAKRKDLWSGTLMLLVQPAEERALGARAMHDDDLWERFGKPDFALAFHVSAQDVAGTIKVSEDFPFLSTDPEIASVYWQVGGTPREAFEREAAGGEPVPSHHSPLFKIDPE